MRQTQNESKPAWSLLYTLVPLLSGLLALVEIFIPSGGPRVSLEIGVVILMFMLMAIWVRYNRVTIELEEWNSLHRPEKRVEDEQQGVAPRHPKISGPRNAQRR